MERQEFIQRGDHVIDITGNGDAPSSSSPHDLPPDGLDTLQTENRPLSSVRSPLTSELPANRLNSRNTTVRRMDSRRRRSPLNSGLWVSLELTLTAGQIIAAIVVLSLSRNEHPRTPLFAWIVGYASGCFATVPLLYWRYRHRDQMLEQGPNQPQQNTQISVPAGPFSLSVTRTSDGEDQQTGTASPRNGQNGRLMSARVKGLVEYFKMALDCFFAVWFVVGCVWVFGGRSSASEAPNLYRLCIVFLSVSLIGYAMPFILCATLCCCLPCIISIMGIREELAQNRGATPELINALPTYKFKVKKMKNNEEGGVVAEGTEKERALSGEDAVCCICLTKYENNEDLRELPCSHVFHKECVDKWLKINAMCPLCKAEVVDTNGVDSTQEEASRNAAE